MFGVCKIKAIILCAGYATRLYPLTLNQPKPLLEVGGKPIVNHLLKKLEEINDLDEVFVVTNNKFYSHFEDWAKKQESSKKISVVNDLTTSNEDRLGSLGDIKFVLDSADVDDNILVVAGDNLFDFSLKPAYDLFKQKNKSVVVLYDVKDFELAKHYGIVAVNDKNKMIDFEEKPEKPKSTLSSTGIYIYPKEVKDRLIKYVNENGQNDKAGNFLEMLHKADDVYCHISQEKWFDIGNLEQLEEARKVYG